MEEFKLQFYFNLYKNIPMSNRNQFRAEFIKRHGEYRYLEELIKMIENWQLKKYGCTLHKNENSKIKQQVNAHMRGKEEESWIRRWKR